MTKAYIKVGGMKIESRNLSTGAAWAFILIGGFAFIPAMIYLSFLLTHWAVYTLFAYNITGWQFIAALILSSVLKSMIYKDN